MTRPADGSVLDASKHVHRTITLRERFVDTTQFPTSADFEPSGPDKTAAAARGTPVRVSVWDTSMTTPARVIAFRETDKPVAVWSLAVVDVNAIAQQRQAMRVVYDAHENTEADYDGHAGIEGLEHQRGEARPAWRAVLAQLAAQCVLAE